MIGVIMELEFVGVACEVGDGGRPRGGNMALLMLTERV